MEYIGIGSIIVIAIVVGIILYTKARKKNDIPSNVKEEINAPLVTGNCQADELVIQVEMLPAEAIEDESKLVEITDSKVLAHVNNLIPGLAQMGNAVGNAVQAVQSATGETLYRAIIPSGAKLAESKTMEGAVRAIYHGADGIEGHANLVAVEAQKGTGAIANSAAAAMGVASMIVGQYYMTQINAEISAITAGISEIREFQDNEYRSRVFSLVEHVKAIAGFRAEIIENNELRLSKISKLDSLEDECTQLLGQANLTLAGIAEKTDIDYDAYEKAVENAQNWFICQKSLLDVLYKISDLRYTLHLGAVSREQCIAMLPTYTQQVQEANVRLAAWHKSTTERLKIDTEKVKRKRLGIDRAIHFIPGLFDEDFNFRSIEKNTAQMIRAQAYGENIPAIDKSDLYSEDIQLIARDGKIYYLPKSRAE